MSNQYPHGYPPQQPFPGQVPMQPQPGQYQGGMYPQQPFPARSRCSRVDWATWAVRS